MISFFVSHNKADREWAEWIAWQLESVGYSIFVQAWDIRPGHNFVLAMQSGLANTERTVAVLSPAYLEARFTQPEWAAAFSQDPTGERGLLVPVKAVEVNLAGVWTSLVYIDLVGLGEEAARSALLDGVSRGRAKPALPPAFPHRDGDDQRSPDVPSVSPAEKHELAPYPVVQSAPKDTLAEWSVLDINVTSDGTHSVAFRGELTRMTELHRLETLAALPLIAEEPSQRGETPDFVGETPSSLIQRLPPTTRMLVGGSSQLCVIVDKLAASYSWETMADPTGASSAAPFAVRSGMIRQLRLRDERVRVLRSATKTALVIGNPTVADPRFPSLAGAAEEAARVAELLAVHGGYDATVLLEEAADPMSVLSAMHQQPWRILHLAVHGVFEFDQEDGREPVNGLVLGDDLFFTMADFNQFRHSPELVFLNFGRLHGTANRKVDALALGALASTWASGLLSMGVMAVVVSGRVVDDDQASITFATEFYRALSLGQTFAVAVRMARTVTYETHLLSSTWGAFHCYGSPHFSFAQPVPALRYLSRSDSETIAGPRQQWLWKPLDQETLE